MLRMRCAKFSALGGGSVTRPRGGGDNALHNCQLAGFGQLVVLTFWAGWELCNLHITTSYQKALSSSQGRGRVFQRFSRTLAGQLRSC